MDMYDAAKAYDKIGFDGVVRPDHVPTMANETNDNSGYETHGRLQEGARGGGSERTRLNDGRPLRKVEVGASHQEVTSTPWSGPSSGIDTWLPV